MSDQIKFGLKNDAEAVYGALNRKREFYLVVQNYLGYSLPHVKVVLTGPPEIMILKKYERYEGIRSRSRKSPLFSIIPKSIGIFSLTATLTSGNNILLTIPIEVRVGNFQVPIKQMLQQTQHVSTRPITSFNCPFCGEKIESYAKFCPICGSKLGKRHEEEKKTKICPNCGQELRLEAKFCVKCGEKVV